MCLQLAKKCYIISPNEMTSENLSPLIYNTVEKLVFNQNGEIADDASDILDYISKENEFDI